MLIPQNGTLTFNGRESKVYVPQFEISRVDRVVDFSHRLRVRHKQDKYLILDRRVGPFFQNFFFKN
jgi:hypothetical protein